MVPSWVPAWTQAQREHLEPVELAGSARASRVFPDLRRFGYSQNRPVAEASELLAFKDWVTDALERSPRTYVLGEGGPEVANTEAQLGPPGVAEPDGFLVARRAPGDVGELIPAPITVEARAAFDAGVALLREGKGAEALTQLRRSVSLSPGVPASRTALADALAWLGDPEAAAAYARAIDVDPTYATAHRGLAELRLAKGDLEGAQRAIAEAWALHPGSAQVQATADRVSQGLATKNPARTPAFRAFLDVDPGGAVRVVAAGDAANAHAAACHALFRWEPQLRAQLQGGRASEPYALSMLEEVICAEAALGAYLSERGGPGEAPALEALLALARADGLSGWALVEILGPARPEKARVAPPAAHEAAVSYVLRQVLSAPRGLPSASPKAVGEAI